MSVRSGLRAAAKGLWFAGVVGACAADFAWMTLSRGHSPDRRQREKWLSRWSKRALRCFAIQVHSRGPFPQAGMLVSNHLSYTDVIVYSSLGECCFVAKHELRSWPVFGFLSRLAGTLFIDRTRRGDTARVNDELAAVLREGHVAVLFPEGTSSDGSAVMHFHSSLFEPAIAAGTPVTAAHISYELPLGGDPGAEVCYWGEMKVLEHLFRVLSHPAIIARVTFGDDSRVLTERKAAAVAMREEVIALAGAQGGVSATGAANLPTTNA